MIGLFHFMEITAITQLEITCNDLLVCIPLQKV